MKNAIKVQVRQATVMACVGATVGVDGTVHNAGVMGKHFGKGSM